MAKTLTIKYVISISNDEGDTSSIDFNKWLPIRENEVLVRKRNNIITRLRIEKNCIRIHLEDNEIKKHLNIPIEKVFVEVEVSDITEELALFIYDERDSPKAIHHGIKPNEEKYKRLEQEYLSLGETVLEAALTIYNRLISFARNHKGQYWLYERPKNLDMVSSMNNEFDAKVRSEDYEWIRWCPPKVDCLTFYGSSEKISISQDEWKLVQEFIESDARPNLISELLANAELLIDKEYRRSAIIEAVAALEIAVSNFGQNAKLDNLLTPEIVSRFDVANLSHQIKHIGFSGTVRFLVPFLFPPKILSGEILKHCQKAIEIRNNVVHNGQRDVNKEDIRALLASIKQTCETIIEFTNSNE